MKSTSPSNSDSSALLQDWRRSCFFSNIKLFSVFSSADYLSLFTWGSYGIEQSAQNGCQTIKQQKVEGLWTKISGIGSYQDKTDYSCPNTDVLWPTSTKPAAIHSTNNLPWIRLLECCLMNSLPRHVSCFWLTVWGGIWFKLTAWQVLNINFATDLNWSGCYSAFRSKLCKLLDILPATITTNV